MVCCIFYSGLYGIGICMYDDVCSISSGVGTEYVQLHCNIYHELYYEVRSVIYISHTTYLHSLLSMYL